MPPSVGTMRRKPIVLSSIHCPLKPGPSSVISPVATSWIQISNGSEVTSSFSWISRRVPSGDHRCFCPTPSTRSPLPSALMTLTWPLMPGNPTFGGPNAICERSGDQAGKVAPIPPSSPVTWRRKPPSSTTKIWLAGLSGSRNWTSARPSAGCPSKAGVAAGLALGSGVASGASVPGEPGDGADDAGVAPGCAAHAASRSARIEYGLGSPHESRPLRARVATSWRRATGA